MSDTKLVEISTLSIGADFYPIDKPEKMYRLIFTPEKDGVEAYVGIDYDCEIATWLKGDPVRIAV